MFRHVLLSAVVFLATTSIAFATTTTHICKSGKIQRRVELTFDETAKGGPCSVKYYKDTEAPGKVTTLWESPRDAGYCKTKTEEFLKKLAGWNYNCAAGTAANEKSDKAETPKTATKAEKPAADDKGVVTDEEGGK